MPTNKQPVITVTDEDRAIVNLLKENPDGLTFAEINERLPQPVPTARLVHASKVLGAIAHDGDREVIRMSKSKISTYNFATADVMKREDGKDWSYTEKEQAILTVAATITSPFTLADLATAMGVEKLSSGSINALVKKGNITKGDQVEVLRPRKSTVAVYKFVKDIE